MEIAQGMDHGKKWVMIRAVTACRNQYSGRGVIIIRWDLPGMGT